VNHRLALQLDLQGLRAIVRAPRAWAHTIWNAIHDQFRDNELHHAVYLDAEFRSIVQGDMDITTYTGKLKRLADALRDVGQPVRETSQVLNMLRGLSSKYRHAVPAITSKQPPHTFLSTRSYMLLEEKFDAEHDKIAGQHTLMASSRSGSNGSSNGGGNSSAPRSTTPAAGDGGSNNPGSRTSSHGSGAPPRNNDNNCGGKKRGRGRCGYNNNAPALRPGQSE
jgi:hypothetical protein